MGEPKMMEECVLKERLGELKFLRIKQDGLSIAWKQAKDEFDALNQNLINNRSEVQERMSELETEIKTHTLEQYELTKEKHQVFGLSIRVLKKIEFKDDDAFAWAKESGQALKLNTPMFKKLALLKAENKEPFDFVKIDEDPSATIPGKIDVGDD